MAFATALLTNRLTRRLKPTWLIVGESVVPFPLFGGPEGLGRLNLRTNLSQVGSRWRRHCAIGANGLPLSRRGAARRGSAEAEADRLRPAR